MVVAVTGGRDHVITDGERSQFTSLLRSVQPSLVIHGGARGVDTQAAAIAVSMGLPVKEYPADWDRYGRSAGFIRNGRLASDCGMLVVFKGGRGTADCVRQAAMLDKKIAIIG